MPDNFAASPGHGRIRLRGSATAPAAPAPAAPAPAAAAPAPPPPAMPPAPAAAAAPPAVPAGTVGHGTTRLLARQTKYGANVLFIPGAPPPTQETAGAHGAHKGRISIR
jgi:hypothetical protein